MNRAQWEAKAAIARMGFRDVESFIASRRKEDRRKREEEFEHAERRFAERRAINDNAAIANWIERFDRVRLSRG